MEQLMKALGYRFRDASLLREALTHPSMGLPNNQRLEFLGDAVLGYVMGEILYEEHPECQEGELTRLRALLVCEHTQSIIAARLNVGRALRMDHGELLSGGPRKPSVLCDALEAIIAAIYLDGGLDEARAFIRRVWPAPDDIPQPVKDAKSALQELLQQGGGATPTYETLSVSGPSHAPEFTVAVLHEGKELSRGTAGSKKQAEQIAATRAIELLKEGKA